jgi:hypothetical protein
MLHRRMQKTLLHHIFLVIYYVHLKYFETYQMHVEYDQKKINYTQNLKKK